MVGELVERSQYHKYMPVARSELHMVELVNTYILLFVTCLTPEAPVQ
jgi:hypothetical protein